jgi:hypothetical protein
MPLSTNTTQQTFSLMAETDGLGDGLELLLNLWSESPSPSFGQR